MGARPVRGAVLRRAHLACTRRAFACRRARANGKPEESKNRRRLSRCAARGGLSHKTSPEMRRSGASDSVAERRGWPDRALRGSSGRERPASASLQRHPPAFHSSILRIFVLTVGAFSETVNDRVAHSRSNFFALPYRSFRSIVLLPARRRMAAMVCAPWHLGPDPSRSLQSLP